MRGSEKRGEVVECVRLKGSLHITGPPRAGKSTLVLNIVSKLRSMGCSIGGIAAPDVVEGGSRVGFKIVDLMSGSEGWLARKGLEAPSWPRLGSYTIVVDDVVNIGVNALKRALSSADIIVIDEIGPMELKVNSLRDAIVRVLTSDKPLLTVFHRRLKNTHPQIFKLILGGCIINMTVHDRVVLGELSDGIARAFAERAKCS